MKRGLLRIGVALTVAASLGACGEAVSDKYEIEQQPYRTVPVPGQDVSRVILTEAAVRHVGIETAAVEQRGRFLVVPYDAVFIDAHGAMWVYTNPKPREFVRASIDIVRETSTEAFLDQGPKAGTRVVTVGVPELYGSETDFT